MKKPVINRDAKLLLIFICSLIFGAISCRVLVAQDFGAHVPWTTCEAESGKTNGQVFSGSSDRGKVSYEASGRTYVELNGPDSYIAFKSPVTANRITIRYSITKGTSGTIGLFINNIRKKDVNLVSMRIWRDKPELPGGHFRFFDEVIAEADVKPGDEIRLVKGNSENLPSCIIDFIDLEQTPLSGTKPDNTWLDVSNFGADGTDELDDTKTLKDCIDAANKGSKKVWIPAGHYYISDQINLPRGVQLAGAGIWYTVVRKNIPATNNRRAFQMADSSEIRDLKIEDILGNVRVDNHEGIRFSSSSGVVIDGVWVCNTFGAGILGAGGSNAVIRNCRITGTFADGIHVARQSQNILAENNFVRNSGDDGMAIVTYNSTGCHDIVYRHNTVCFNYWGRGITMIGGDHNILEKNLVIDGSKAGMLVAIEEYNQKITPYVTNFLVQNNRILRCGDITTQNRGGISVWGNIQTSPMSGIIRNNEIIDPIYHGISVHNWVPGEVIIQNNAIGEPRTKGCMRYFKQLKDGFSPTFSGNTEYGSALIIQP